MTRKLKCDEQEALYSERGMEIVMDASVSQCSMPGGAPIPSDCVNDMIADIGTHAGHMTIEQFRAWLSRFATNRTCCDEPCPCRDAVKKAEPLSKDMLRLGYVRRLLHEVKAQAERIATLEAENAELRRDAARLDWCADNRICDGINGVDIDELTLAAIGAKGLEGTEEEWKAEWRIQFRVALDADPGMLPDEQRTGGLGFSSAPHLSS